MKRNLIFAAILTLISGAASVWANSCIQLLGDPANANQADRTIVINADTDYVNITHFDTIKFVAGNQSFTWHFDGVSTLSEIDLNKISPPGMLDHTVRVYIEKSPDDLDGA